MDANGYTVAGLKEILEENNIEIPKGAHLKAHLVKLYEEQILKKKRKPRPTRSSSRINNVDDSNILIPSSSSAPSAPALTPFNSSMQISDGATVEKQQHQVMISTSMMDISLSSDKPISCLVNVDGVTYSIKPKVNIQPRQELFNNFNTITTSNNNTISNNDNSIGLNTIQADNTTNRVNNTNTITNSNSNNTISNDNSISLNNIQAGNSTNNVKFNNNTNTTNDTNTQGTTTSSDAIYANTRIKLENEDKESETIVKKTKIKSDVENRITKPIKLRKRVKKLRARINSSD
ncbi:predicted protein [Naegleria gruberi]|uniref:Predicted protein n=1 Tax=Naegleria gruberi TaxID=5762 RepID=D2VUL6_NAEGR|nr:uncharacterized protein NAEGRDRAFT_52383 [Naegleria gruberi]EFC39530.1 predicted protein [Naegleria gruberi]|eukprot:XP_002672274.1 predicted protein [Naegleria gruberi strain NEG-M]